MLQFEEKNISKLFLNKKLFGISMPFPLQLPPFPPKLNKPEVLNSKSVFVRIERKDTGTFR